ncbi:MAG: nucleotide exchange factor GrpE [Planctomycetota bacterium]
MSGKTRSAQSKKTVKSKANGETRATPGRGTRSKSAAVSRKDGSTRQPKNTGTQTRTAGAGKTPAPKSKRAKVAIADARKVAAHKSVVRKASADEAAANKDAATGRRTAKPAATNAATSPSVRGARTESNNVAPTDVLAKAEADIGAVIESLNTQMTIALGTLTELAVSQRGREEAVIRTAPIDRATATFQRIVAEVVDDQLAEMLPLLVDLRNEMVDWRHGDEDSSGDDDFVQRATELLDRVLTTARVTRFDARPGEPFDPVIHLAVGETHRDDLADGAVAESLRSGFRGARGNVLSPARVKVNRR